MNNLKLFKVVFLLAAIIVSSYVVATGGPAARNANPTVADGNALYVAKCATCHGKDGRGIPNMRSKGQPDFTEAAWQKSKTDAQITEATKNGKGKLMPAFKTKMSDVEIAAVVARVRSFGKK